MIYPALRRLLDPLSSTPLHPQWLMRRKFVLRYQWLAAHISEGCVLDVGCGNQRLRAVLPKSVRYMGLDYPSTTTLGYAGRPDVYGNAQRLPFRDASFDAVALLDVLEHIPHPAAAISEAARVLRPGGLIVCQTPFMYPLHDLPYDYQRWTAEGIRQMATDHSMALLEIKPYGNSIETAVTLANIALVKSVLYSYEKGHLGFLLLPMIVVMIPFINMLGWLLARLLDDPDFMPLGYSFIFKKHAQSLLSG